MALPVSSISQTCRSVRDFLDQQLDRDTSQVAVTIGSPAEAVPGSGDSDHRVNLFFFRVEPSGFESGIAPDEPWRIRINCFITAFGIDEDNVSAGENDLRLVGEVMRIFHETPVLPSVDVDGQQVRLQAVFDPQPLDQINHLWATQGDVTYRPSVMYEFAVSPVVPRQQHVASPWVGAVGQEVRGDMSAIRQPYTGTAATPPVRAQQVDVEREDWAPLICFIYQNMCVQALAFEIGSSELAAFAPAVWVAGQPGSSVSLRWDVWDSAQGWQTNPSTGQVAAVSMGLDPEQATTAITASATLPFNDRAGQAVLYATRQYQRASDGATLEVRSNPLLVTLYEAFS